MFYNLPHPGLLPSASAVLRRDLRGEGESFTTLLECLRMDGLDARRKTRDGDLQAEPKAEGGVEFRQIGFTQLAEGFAHHCTGHRGHAPLGE